MDFASKQLYSIQDQQTKTKTSVEEAEGDIIKDSLATTRWNLKSILTESE